ncbi:YgdI/YgdR family lipoprotein [Spartinivicinus poritis]|uniref:YgdI/YgdR family lipoprotein n=1 Tax=Spartinivicinus poritis TaxID=2994640 RepID=A0ABT5U5L1_9GAMM|nr:YgdI/YgdR family lipoprotein [Spartinivicinus sp. A2-2]MDE1461650.1 YgdI/YgdR family lipoprotein [Spartinivicinus sp. A2-2]
MKQLFFVFSVAALLAGCSSPQVIKMKDGSTINTPDELYFNEDTGFYEYEDTTGRLRTVNKDEIVTIDDL